MLLACGDAESVLPDALDVLDLGRPSDASLSTDAGSEAEAGMEPDAGLPVDAGPSADSGALEPDAESPDSGGPDVGTADSGSTADAGLDAGVSEDFALPGSYAVENLSFTVSNIAVECRAPVGRSAGPAVLISHGFQLPASQYLLLAGHLASWGMVACSVDFVSRLTGNHVQGAAEIAGVFDALVAGSVPALSGRVDPARIALAGHSLGGKLSFLVASDRPAAAAVVGMDPVDAKPALCSTQNCPSAIGRLPIGRPTLILGETADEAGGMACNPAAENFDDFYAASGPGTQEVVIAGASHMSFIDDLSACGLTCAFCQDETAARSELVEVIRWFTTAFLLQSLDGRTDLEPALTGALAQSRFVQPNRVSLRSK